MAFQQRVAQGQLAASAGALLTAGTNEVWTITKVVLFGEEADTDTKLYVVPNGGIAGATNEFARSTSIAQGEQVIVPLSGQVLYSGMTLQGESATANRINYAISYTRQTDA
jgi:hypothetical protein